MRQPYYYGVVELGSAIPVRVQCADSSDAPQAPDSAPTFTVYDSANAAMSAYTGTSSSQINSKTGFYGGSVTASLGNGFASGSVYTVLWEWTVSSSPRRAVGTFQVG